MNDIRKMSVAGSFYPASSPRLKEFVETQLDVASSDEAVAVRALLVPHAGYQFSGPTAAKAYASLISQKERFKRVVILAPTHQFYYKGISLGNYGAYETPFGDIPVDVDACEAIIAASSDASFLEEAHVQEHAIEVQLPFLYQVLGTTPIVPVLCGEMSEECVSHLAVILQQYWNEETLWLVSSDFTHYGAAFNYLPFNEHIQDNLRTLDAGVISEILGNSVQGFRAYIKETGATVCGHHPIELLLQVIADESLDISLCDYTTSAAITGEEQHSVSYVSMSFADKGVGMAEKADFILNDDEKKLLHQLVREAIEAEFSQKELKVRQEVMPEVLLRNACCFVTLHLNGKLRGCIGHIEATEPLYLNVIHNAKAAAFSDYRFMPLTEDELADVEIEISVLTPPRDVESCQDIVLGKHGIIFQKGSARSLFLPQVASEQGWDLETTLSYLAQKAGLEPNAWRAHSTFRVFEALVF